MKKMIIILMLAGGGVLSEADFTAHFIQEEIPERGPVSRCVLKTGVGDCSFIPPSGWTFNTEPGKDLISMVARHLDSGLHLEFEESKKLSREQLREKLKKKYPDARILEEYQCHAQSAQGVTLESTITIGERQVYTVRLALLPMRSGTVLLRLVAPPDKMDKAHLAWITVLNSMRIE